VGTKDEDTDVATAGAADKRKDPPRVGSAGDTEGPAAGVTDIRMEPPSTAPETTWGAAADSVVGIRGETTGDTGGANRKEPALAARDAAAGIGDTDVDVVCDITVVPLGGVAVR
jgi:hypothetical protein